jgi:hypothetical protein
MRENNYEEKQKKKAEFKCFQSEGMKSWGNVSEMKFAPKVSGSSGPKVETFHQNLRKQQY